MVFFCDCMKAAVLSSLTVAQNNWAVRPFILREYFSINNSIWFSHPTCLSVLRVTLTLQYVNLFQDYYYATKYSNVGISTGYLSKIRRSNKKDIYLLKEKTAWGNCCYTSNRPQYHLRIKMWNASPWVQFQYFKCLSSKKIRTSDVRSLHKYIT